MRRELVKWEPKAVNAARIASVSLFRSAPESADGRLGIQSQKVRDEVHRSAVLGTRSVLVKNPCQVPAVMKGILSIRGDNIGQFHGTAFRVVDDDSGRIRLAHSGKPVHNRDAQRPYRALEGHIVVVPGLREHVGVVGDNVRIRTSCHGYEPFSPNPCVVGHMCDIAGNIPPEISESLPSSRVYDEPVYRVRERAHD